MDEKKKREIKNAGKFFPGYIFILFKYRAALAAGLYKK